MSRLRDRAVTLAGRWRVHLLRVMLVAGLVGALGAAASYGGLEAWPDTVAYRWLVLAGGLQLVSWAITGTAWRLTLAALTPCRPSLLVGVRQVVLVMVGKYVPGKVWGIAARLQDLQARGVGYAAGLQATYVEQLLSAHSGLALGVVATALALGHPVGALGLAALTLASFPLVPVFHDRLIGVAVRLLARALRRDSDRLPASVPMAPYPRLAPWYLLDWVVAGTVPLCLYGALVGASPGWSTALVVVGANAAGVVVGFFAVFAPGGLGVREGVASLILANVMPLEQAVLLMVAYRLWGVLAEAAAGVVLLGVRERRPDGAAATAVPGEDKP